MKCINFDKEFERYLTRWVKEHQKEFKNYDQMEAKMPEVYNEWLETPLDWLGHLAPGHYFDQFDSAKFLINHLEDYTKQRVPVPDMLMDRITSLGEESEQPLCSLLEKERAPEEAKMFAVTLLREIGSEKPLPLYLDWVSDMEDEDEYEDCGYDCEDCEEGCYDCVNELAENALESLEAMGEKAVAGMLEHLDGATDAGKESFCSLLCRYPDKNEKVFTVLMNLLNTRRDRCAILADLLGKLGNEKALGPLKALAASEETGYLDYIELRNAIEALGGEAPEREFDEKDPDYDALRALEAREAEKAARPD